jgi:acetyl-CoA carboxylase biotin carboxyl carrier protein
VAGAAPVSPVGAAAGPPAGTEVFTSPMVGTFYRAPSPDAEVFVREGDAINEDSTLCIIEAMKVMNEIKAEMRGEVVEILVQNGEPVDYGQPLFAIKT